MNFKHTYIIGEIGQNHNGSVDIAKLIVELISRPIKDELFNLSLEPMDAVKMTKRDLTEELSDSQKNKIYDTPNSFGRTYGDHREYLELTNEEHFEVYKFAREKNLEFVETLCALKTLSMLKLFTPDKLKVASRDLTNLPLLTAMAETRIPIILSTGMGGRKELDDAINIISKYHSDIAILHCVSEYPTKPQNVNFNTISYLMKNYGQYVIGYSDHTFGISAAVAATALGAKIIEKHITIDRRMKGTDQSNSLGPDGVARMVRDIRLTELSMGVEDIFISDDVKNNKIKLERSIATKRRIKIGEVITENDIHMLSPGDGFKWIDKERVIGKQAAADIPANEIIYPGLIQG